MTDDAAVRGKIHARAVVSGAVSAEALVSSEPLSFWGGFDPETGEIVDRRHPLSGRVAAGKVLALPFTKGSSTTTAILLEAIRRGTAPAAIVSRGTDAFLSLAAIVADEMYAKTIPVVAVSREDFDRLQTGEHVSIQPDGTITVDGQGAGDVAFLDGTHGNGQHDE